MEEVTQRGAVLEETKKAVEGEADFQWEEGVEGGPLMDERQGCWMKLDQHHHGD